MCLLLVLLGWPCLTWADISTNLTVRWKTDEGTGSTLADNTGNGHIATFGANAPTWLTGANCHSGACLSFANQNQSATFTAITSGTTWTWAAWVYPSTGAATFAQLFVDLGAEAIYYVNTGANARKMLYDGSFYSTTLLTLDTWQHVAFVVNAGAWTWYINGAAAGTGTGVLTRGYDSIGSSADGFTGRLDEMWLFVGRALSAGDITELMNQTDAAPRKRVWIME